MAEETSILLRRKPPESAIHQQKLNGQLSVYTVKSFYPILLIIGFIFIPIGVSLIFVSHKIQEKSIDYTFCSNKNDNRQCADVIKVGEKNCLCELNFTLNENFNGKIYFYYELENYYQNHRLYIKSRDDDQLNGYTRDEPSRDCHPFDKHGGKAIFPCGTIANSIFNDTLTVYTISGNLVPMVKTGIAWDFDKNVKYSNVEKTEVIGFSRPLNWNKELWELDIHDKTNNMLKNEDFMVWMRPAGIPNFRKLYRLLDIKKSNYTHGLPKGDYILKINYNYPVYKFGGRKKFIISTASFIGSKNPFLGYLYITIGSICILLGLIFLTIHIRPRWFIRPPKGYLSRT